MNAIKPFFTELRKVILVVLSVFCFLPSASADEYLLAKGDVLEFQVLGIPDLRQRAAIGLDGSVLLPLVGEVQAAGRTLSAVREAVASQASQKSYPVRGESGADTWQLVHPEAVVLQVLEYRPVYLNGDVATPGEQPYRSGMTVRQAVAVAGGYDLVRFRMANPILELTDLRAQYNSTWIRLAAGQVREERLKAELTGLDQVDFSNLGDAYLPTGLLPDVQQLESELLASRTDDHSKEQEAISRALQQTERRLELLTERQRNEQIATDEDTAEYERVKRLYDQGLTQITRLNDARRAVLLWLTRTLETSAEAARMERERNDLERNLVRVADTREMDLLAELQAAKVDVADLKSQLQGKAEKIAYVGALRSELASGGGMESPHITIVRRTAEGVAQYEGGEDTELLPGDVVEIKLDTEWLIAPLMQSSARH